VKSEGGQLLALAVAASNLLARLTHIIYTSRCVCHSSWRMPLASRAQCCLTNVHYSIIPTINDNNIYNKPVGEWLAATSWLSGHTGHTAFAIILSTLKCSIGTLCKWQINGTEPVHKAAVLAST